MAGMPYRHARRTFGLKAQSVAPPEAWRKLSSAEKFQLLLGWGLDDAYVVAHWPLEECDLHQLSAKQRQFEALMRAGTKFTLEAARSAQQRQAVEDLAKALSEPMQKMALSEPTQKMTPADPPGSPRDSLPSWAKE